LIRRLQRKGVVSNEAEDIYVYGFELLVSFVFNYIDSNFSQSIAIRSRFSGADFRRYFAKKHCVSALLG